MDTKFKNKDLLIKVLNKCILRYCYLGTTISIKHMIINQNITFEQALCACKPLYNEKAIYHTISKAYHREIRQLNTIKKHKRSVNDV